jgi:dUTP pyrophosphatase
MGDEMKVNIKKLKENAVIPKYESAGAAGMDLTATSKTYDKHGNVVYGTGLAFEIPEGYVGYIFPRSSNAKKDLLLSNSIGVIDSDYRGEVIFKFKELPYKFGNMASYAHPKSHEVGDRIGQIIIMPYPKIDFVEVDELDETERGSGGFGSTG